MPSSRAAKECIRRLFKMNYLNTCFLLLFLISCTPSIYRQDLLMNYGIRYKPADSATNAIAYNKLQDVFSKNNYAVRLFDSATGCFPFIWSELKGNPYFVNADGAQLCLSAGNNKVFIGKIIRHNRFLDSLQSYMANSVKLDTPLVIRKLNDDELRIFWSMIPYDIEEPLYILVSKSRKLILEFKKDFVMNLEDISNSHYIAPIPLESVIDQLPDLNKKQK